MRIVRYTAVALVATLAFAALANGAETIQAPDGPGDVGKYSSLVLDAAGNPVVAYIDWTNRDLKLLHCNDPACAGGNESITTPDTGLVTGWPTVRLNAAGNPVVAYVDNPVGLNILTCNDPNCAPGGDVIAIPDTSEFLGFSELVLDAAGNPVVAYHRTDDEGGLYVLHCNDPICVGLNESIVNVVPGFDGWFPSMKLDASGNPVIANVNADTLDAKLLHCNDPNCAGANESVQTLDTTGVNLYTSLALDGAGNPVVSMDSGANGLDQDLKIIHCNDPNCSGGNESVESPDTATNTGHYGSLQLDAAGNPVVSYSDFTNSTLRVMHCNDPNCAGGGESFQSPDTGITLDVTTSLKLDAAGNPVVSYYDATNGNLKILHCDDPACNADGTAPTTAIALDPAAPDGLNLWYVSAVGVTVSATDEVGGSGVAETRCVLDPASVPATFDDIPSGCAYTPTKADVTSDGQHTVYAASKDNAGNKSSVVDASFQIDQTAPTVTCGTPPVFTLGSSGGTVSATVTDDASGSGPLTSPISASVTSSDTTTVGVKTKPLTGYDNAGNQSTVNCSYIVGYQVLGFFSPLPRQNVTAGSTVPVKFALADNNGTRISDSEAQAIVAGCKAQIFFPVLQPSPNCFKYDPTTDQFIFNLKTPKDGAGLVTITAKVFSGASVINTTSTQINLT